MNTEHTFIVVVDTKSNSNSEAFDLYKIEYYMMLQIFETFLTEKQLNEEVDAKYVQLFYPVYKKMTKYLTNDEAGSVAIVTKIPANFNINF